MEPRQDGSDQAQMAMTPKSAGLIKKSIYSGAILSLIFRSKANRWAKNSERNKFLSALAR